MSVRELLSPHEPPLAAAQAALKAWFNTRPGAVTTSERRYYDTFDGLLHEAGYALWHAQGAYTLQAFDGRTELHSDAPGDAPDAPFFAPALPDGPLKQLVAAKTGVRALLVIADVQVRSETLLATDLFQQTVAIVHADSASVIAPDGTRTDLATRVQAGAVTGYEREREKAQQLLEQSPQLTAAPASLIDEAVRACGGNPGGFSTAPETPMHAQERADVVVARVLTRLLEVLDATLPGTLADIDPEFLHDYRVAVRRTRSVLKEMPRVFRPDELARIRSDFRWLQEVTGETRDLDVWALEFEDLRELTPETLRAHMQPLKLVIDKRHAAARAEMEIALSSGRAQQLHEQWSALLQGLVVEDESDRPDAARPIAKLASHRIRKVHRAMVRMGGAIDSGTDPHHYHELRKRGKELRYLLELFGVRLYDPAVVRPMIKALKGLQDVLGRHQDRDVQIQTLKRLAPEVMAPPDGALALMALGALIERLDEDAAAARRQFADAFREFSSPEQIALVGSTFGGS